MKTRIRGALADHRKSAVLRAAARLSLITLNATRNQYNWDFGANGEAWTLRWALQHQHGAVFDVGANVGQWALHALPYLDGRPLHCFEAIPAVAAELRANLAASADVTVNDLALGSTSGAIGFNYCRNTSDVSSRYGIPAEIRDDSVERVAVQMATGEEYCTARRVDRIAMLKVDVEGMEYEVLEGFGSVLRERRIGVIQFEYGTGYIGARRYLGDVCALLEGAGYTLFRQFPRGLEPFAYSETEEDFRPRNFVAIRRKPGAGHPLGDAGS